MREMKNSGVEWIGKIPSEWTLERLQWHLTEIKEPNNPIKTKQILSLTNKLGVIPYEEKGSQGNVAKENYDEYKIAYPNTIVANSMNVLIGSVGICNYFGCVSPVYYVLMPNKMDNLEFLNYIFQTVQFQKELRRYANGILEIRLRVSSAGILKRIVAFPSHEMQQNIVNTLNKRNLKIDALISNQEQQIEKLKQYKQSLITEVVTKGLNPDVPMKDSGTLKLGSIPDNWKTVRFKNVAILCNGKEVTSNSGNIPVYGSGGVFKYTDQPLFTGTSLLLGRKGTIDNPMLVTDSFWTVDTMFYTSKIYGINPKYLYYACVGEIDFNYYKSGSVLPSMTQTEINNIFITCPDKFEQKKIVDFLDKKCAKIDRLIAIKQEKIDKLNDYKKSLIYEYVTGKKEA